MQATVRPWAFQGGPGWIIVALLLGAATLAAMPPPAVATFGQPGCEPTAERCHGDDCNPDDGCAPCSGSNCTTTGENGTGCERTHSCDPEYVPPCTSSECLRDDDAPRKPASGHNGQPISGATPAEQGGVVVQPFDRGVALPPVGEGPGGVATEASGGSGGGVAATNSDVPVPTPSEETWRPTPILDPTRFGSGEIVPDGSSSAGPELPETLYPVESPTTRVAGRAPIASTDEGVMGFVSGVLTVGVLAGIALRPADHPDIHSRRRGGRR